MLPQSIVIYILLFLDQEVLTEPTNYMGGRAYRARTLALAQHQAQLNAERNAVSTAGPLQMSERSDNVGPMAGGATSRALPRQSEDTNPLAGRRYQDEEEEGLEETDHHHDHDDGEDDENAGGYYGFNAPRMSIFYPSTF